MMMMMAVAVACVPGRAGFLWPGLNAPVFRAGAPQAVSRRGDAEQLEMQAELGTHQVLHATTAH